jgi:hypothetical protein
MWEAIVKGFERILERPAILLLILGFVLFVLGAANGIKYNGWLVLDDTKGWISLIFGALLMLFGGALGVEDMSHHISARSYKIKITSPTPNQTVTRADVTGTVKRLPPGGYKLMILRIYDNQKIVPLKEVRFERDGKRWSADDCDLGGTPGKRRTIGAYLVGKSGQALIQYYEEATEFHKGKKEDPNEFLPMIIARTEDMIKGDEVTVIKG